MIPSLRRLFRDLHTFLPAASPWVLLTPGSASHLTLWHQSNPASLPLADPAKVMKAIAAAPTGGHPATTRAEWANALVKGLFGQQRGTDEHFIVPFFQGPVSVGFLGWPISPDGGSTHNLQSHVSLIRRVFRAWHDREKGTMEVAALRWVLARSDRPTAVVQADGVMIGASSTGSDLLKGIQYGDRHYFHADGPQLPPGLVRAISGQAHGQLKLSSRCTARFQVLEIPGMEWAPLIGIEFFTDSLRPTLALSCLTPVERDVCERARMGATNPQIAKARGTSAATVKNQMSQCLAKLGLSRRTELIAAQAGAVHLPDISSSPTTKGGTFMTR
jgi:DNA-binding NarL/FixJ family response regulator